MLSNSQYAKAETAYRADRIRQDFGGVRRQRTRIPFVGRIAEVSRRTR